MAENSPSIKEIAAIAGVSTATVSRVLNGKGGYGEETRQRVLSVLQTRGYVVNSAARALREARTRTVGLIVPNIDNPFFSVLAFHVEELLYREGYSLFICNSGGQPEKERSHLRSLLSKQADGILCVSALQGLETELRSPHPPIVAMDRRPDPALGVPCAVNDDRAAGAAAVRHLLERGCRNLLLLSFPSGSGGSLREQGCLEALEEAGIPVDQNYILRRPGAGAAIEEFETEVGRFWDDGRFPTDGIVALSEWAALGALSALEKRGVSVPGQVRLITFDNTILSRITYPRLTAVDRDPQGLAQRACTLLLQAIRGEPAGDPVHLVPFRIRERESTCGTSAK